MRNSSMPQGPSRIGAPCMPWMGEALAAAGRALLAHRNRHGELAVASGLAGGADSAAQVVAVPEVRVENHPQFSARFQHTAGVSQHPQSNTRMNGCTAVERRITDNQVSAGRRPFGEGIFARSLNPRSFSVEPSRPTTALMPPVCALSGIRKRTCSGCAASFKE